MLIAIGLKQFLSPSFGLTCLAFLPMWCVVQGVSLTTGLILIKSYNVSPPGDAVVLNEMSNQDITKRTYQGHVLVVDDSETNVLLLRYQLKQLGLKVTTSNNGLDAFEKACSVAFDLIFMDLFMPQMSGLDTVKKIRDCHVSVPIVALSGRSDPQDKEECLAAGFNAYLEKSDQEKGLAEVLSQFLQPANASDPVDLAQSHSLNSTNDFDSPVDLLKQAYGDDILVDKIIATFCKDADSILEGLTQAVEQHNSESILYLSHKLAGAAGIVQASQLAEIAHELEKISSSDDSILLARHLSRLQRVYDDFNELIADYR